MHHIQEPHEQQIIILSLLVIRTAQFPSKTNSQEMTPKLAELILKVKFMRDTFIMEHFVRSRKWFLKHWWKNERKILFCSGDRRFWRFWKVLVLRLPNCLDTRQIILGSNIWHVTLGNFFSQKPYVSLVSATLWIMETVHKSSLGNLDEVLKDLNRAVFQTEPKLVIKWKHLCYHENIV